MNHSVIREIHMPKINSGLFKVPWEQTETVLKQFPEITFYVYSK
jgi:predicted NUDIX family NTP pyrophosphohydrolase